MSFQHLQVPRANGTIYVTAFFSCTVCTVFLDLVAFTRGYEDRPRNTWRAPAEPTSYQQGPPSTSAGASATSIALDLDQWPQVWRADGKEFCGKAMLAWAHERAIVLRLIGPGRPNQNAYIESFNGSFRDECLNEHWFASLAHAQVVIEAWRREYNEERPRKSLAE